MVKREVSSLEYEKALANPTNARVLRKAARKYQGELHQDDVDSCALSALWRTLRCHDDSYGQKFTTSLWRFMNWECQKAVRRLARWRRFVPLERLERELASAPASPDPLLLDHVVSRMSSLTASQRRELARRYLDGADVKQIARESSTSPCAVRKRLSRALRALREVCVDGV